MALLRLDDRRQVERPRPQHDRDQDEADRDFVTDHLRRRTQRRIEGVFRVGRPTRHDDAVHAQRRRREDVEQPDIDVRQHHARIERDHRPGDQRDREGDDRREQEQPLVRGGRNDRFLKEDLQTVGERLEQAERPDDVGTAPQRHRRPDLAIDIDDHRHRQHQRQRDQQDARDRRDGPCPFIGHAERLEESGHATLLVIPAKAGISLLSDAPLRHDIPAFAGMADLETITPRPPHNPGRGPVPPNSAASSAMRDRWRW